MEGCDDLGEHMAESSRDLGCWVELAVLAARQHRVGRVPLDLLHLCGDLQVLGKGGEALGAAQQSRRLLRRGEVHGGQAGRVGLRRHGHGVV